jgi:transposase
MGFQPLNGVPVLTILERTNRATFSLHQFEVRIHNIINENISRTLYEFTKSKELTEKYIKEKLKSKLPTKEELNEKVVAATEKNYDNLTALDKRLKRIFSSINVKNKKVVEIQEQILYKWMEENQWIFEELQKEKRIVMVLDNYSAHLSKLAKDVAKFLNIKLLFLPVYSPKYNPIEQVWRSMKRKISSIDFKTIESLLYKVKFYYSKFIKEKTFTDKWVKKFLSKS